MYAVTDNSTGEIVCLATRQQDIECYLESKSDSVTYTVELIDSTGKTTVQTHSDFSAVKG